MRSVQEIIGESLQAKSDLLSDTELLAKVEDAAGVMIDSYQQGGKVLFCGNGGSAADAQHFAAELSGRFLFDRPPLAAEALHGNTSFLTAVANDYNYESVYARAVRASGRPGDVLVALSTSGTSGNIIAAAQTARDLEMNVIALTGASSCRLGDVASVWLPMPTTVTGRIQECHIAVIHAISEQVEAALFASLAAVL